MHRSQQFNKEGNGFNGASDLRYVFTQLEERRMDAELNELIKGVQVQP